MISEVTIVAIVGAAATVLVGVSAALAQVFGPAWRDAKTKRLERQLAADDERFERAEALMRGLNIAHGGGMGSGSVFLEARVRFVSTLRKGEGAVARYVAAESIHVARTSNTRYDQVYTEFAETLFGYLRGDVSLAELVELTTRRSKEPPTA